MVVCRRTDFGRCSRRRLRPSTRLVLAWLAAVAGPCAAQSQTGPGVERLDAFLTDVHTLTADFKQELWSPDQTLIETQSGTLMLERPDHFRWEYRGPSKQLTIVADGKKLWMYDVDLAEVTVAPLDESVASSPARLLSSSGAVHDNFNVVDTYARDGLDWVKLTPKAVGGDFSSIAIGFADRAPQRLELVDGLNQVTKIELTNVRVNPKIDAAEFEFKAPPGVDVIGSGG